jgi:hypothetical protein
VSFFQQILPWATRHGNILLFWLIWVTITAAAAIWMASAVRHVAAPTSQKAIRRPIDLIPIWRAAGAPRAVAALTLLAVFLASYVAMTLVWEDFAYYDNQYFTQITLKGHNLSYGISMNRESGRFWPLGLQEFNLVRHFTHTITGYVTAHP